MNTVLQQSRIGRTTHSRTSLFADKTLTTGYLLLVFSTALFAATEWSGGEVNAFTLFMVHYGFALVYVIWLIARKAFGVRRCWRPEHLGKTMVLLHLFLVSAFALNREIAVFEESTAWMSVFIVFGSVALLAIQYLGELPAWVRRTVLALTGSVLVFYTYLALYTLPWYGFGLLGILLLGIGAHIFVPFLIFTVAWLQLRTQRLRNSQKAWIVGGTGLTLLFVLAFAVEYVNRVETIQRIANHSVLHPGDALPVWVQVGQEVEDNWITIRALKSDIVYTTWDRFRGNLDFFPRGGSWNEPRRHDPLVFIGSIFGRHFLKREDVIRVLQVNPSFRHTTEKRLWNGNDLSTSFVVSDIDVYPDLRIAFTEQYLTVRNNALSEARGSTQEAIYTFHLPEGSVVTALSLWINGVEEKGILTSRQRAAEAYETVVGVERRDPSVIHWQEGNTVSVRVFPCTPDEERKFRIGVTSPLPEHDGLLTYRKMTFQGPAADDAKETMRIRIIGNNQVKPTHKKFTVTPKGEYMHEGSYDPDFAFTVTAPPLMPNRFSFGSHTYSIEKAAPEFVPLDVRKIYVDINRWWTRKELSRIKLLAGRYPVYVFHGADRIRLSAENWARTTGPLQAHNYSVFPFHKIPEGGLVITKGTQHSPLVKDFGESQFAQELASHFSSGKSVPVFDIGTANSNYISTLRELRALRYTRGTLEQLEEMLIEGEFPVYLETEDRVHLHDAALWINRKIRDDGGLPDNAPDHLARLFAYNAIMRKAGAHYFDKDLMQDELIKLASQAYVVSPVSSLIVLEKKSDYDRFNIEESKNSLLNAKKETSGAVPEPHEWALIITFLLLILYTARNHLLKIRLLWPF